MAKPVKYARVQRFQWYKLVFQDKKPVSEVCQLFGVARKTYYYWQRRDYGLNGNKYRTPGLQPNLKLTYEVRCFIEKNKLISNYGPLKMKMLVKKKLGLNLSTTIIYRYYQKHKLIRKPQRRLAWYTPMTERLTINQAGQGVQIDIKYVYPNSKRAYQFSIFDPYTKKYYFMIFPSKHSVHAIKVFKQAQRYFGFEIKSIQSDNGSEFRGDFHIWLTRRKIAHYFIPKRSPWWNGCVERVHRTMDEEYYLNTYRVWTNPYSWLHYYNFKRIHLSLNGLTPQEKLLQSVTIDC